MKCYLFIFIIFVCINISHAQSEKAIALYNKGVEYNKTGYLVKASIKLTNAISLYPDYAQAYYQRSLSFKGMGQAESANKDAMKSIDLGIQNINPYLAKINYFKSTKQYKSAILITKKLILAMPENAAGAYNDQGLIYEEINKPCDAIISYKKSMKLLDADSHDSKQALLNKIELLQEKIQ